MVLASFQPSLESIKIRTVESFRSILSLKYFLPQGLIVIVFTATNCPTRLVLEQIRVLPLALAAKV